MSRNPPRPAAVAAVVAAMLATVVAAPSCANVETLGGDGLALYLQRCDAAAMRELERSHRRDAITPLARLALADLYVMAGRAAKAQLLLQSVPADGSIVDVPVWQAWLEFLSGRPAEASRRLFRLLESGTIEPGRIRLSLAWQLLLRGRAADAARVLDGSDPDTTLPDAEARRTLLRGQALLWAGALEDAEQVLGAVGAPTLRPDAARDIAWIHFRRGEVERASAELQAVVELGDSGGSSLAIPWHRALRSGPQVLRRGWLRAYRGRPRGEDPTVFLASLVDRDAAADARGMLALIATTAAGSTGPTALASRRGGLVGQEREPRAAHAESVAAELRRPVRLWLLLVVGALLAVMICRRVVAIGGFRR